MTETPLPASLATPSWQPESTAPRREVTATFRHRAIAAIRAFLSSHTTAVGRLTAATFEITDFGQAEKLATMLAMQYPDPDRAALGIWELIANAIEHGSLGIGFSEKTDLMRAGEYDIEVRRRLADPELGRRIVRVAFRRTSKMLMLTVTDQGAGFDHAHFAPPNDSHWLPNGRGIRIAREISFDGLTYHGRGNRVVARTRLPAG